MPLSVTVGSDDRADFSNPDLQHPVDSSDSDHSLGPEVSSDDSDADDLYSEIMKLEQLSLEQHKRNQRPPTAGDILKEDRQLQLTFHAQVRRVNSIFRTIPIPDHVYQHGGQGSQSAGDGSWGIAGSERPSPMCYVLFCCAIELACLWFAAGCIGVFSFDAVDIGCTSTCIYKHTHTHTHTHTPSHTHIHTHTHTNTQTHTHTHTHQPRMTVYLSMLCLVQAQAMPCSNSCASHGFVTSLGLIGTVAL
jgi:hypothetical protein